MPAHPPPVSAAASSPRNSGVCRLDPRACRRYASARCLSQVLIVVAIAAVVGCTTSCETLWGGARADADSPRDKHRGPRLRPAGAQILNAAGVVEEISESDLLSEKCPRAPASKPTHMRGKGRYRYLDEISVEGLQPRRLTVYLPESYEEESERRYPVLYAHDGQLAYAEGEGLGIDASLDQLTEEGVIEAHILVTIDRTKARSQELTPCYGRCSRPSLERYARMLVDVVKPMIDATFRTRCGRHSTSIVGYSLGGLANLFFVWMYPDVFGALASMSPSYWWQGGAVLNDFHEYKGPMPDRLWIDSGTKEGRPHEAVPYFIHDIRKARDIAIAKGMVLGRNLGYLEDPGARHAGWAGARRMNQVIAFLRGHQLPDFREPSHVSVYVFRETIAPKAVTSLAVNLLFGEHFLMTWPNKQVKLLTRSSGIAKVGSDGLVYGLNEGTAIIEAQYGSYIGRDRVHIDKNVPTPQAWATSSKRSSATSAGKSP